MAQRRDAPEGGEGTDGEAMATDPLRLPDALTHVPKQQTKLCFFSPAFCLNCVRNFFLALPFDGRSVKPRMVGWGIGEFIEAFGPARPVRRHHFTYGITSDPLVSSGVGIRGCALTPCLHHLKHEWTSHFE